VEVVFTVANLAASLILISISKQRLINASARPFAAMNEKSANGVHPFVKPHETPEDKQMQVN
jgi:hypothetical protein